MTSKVQINKSYRTVNSLPSCIPVSFYERANNPFLPIAATDDRGTFFGLDYSATRPFLVEIIHSKPKVVRGNHIHARSTEIFTTLSGSLDMYLLCQCTEKHIYKKRMSSGTTVKIAPGVAHAVHTQSKNESIAIFYDNDPRQDRERIELIRVE